MTGPPACFWLCSLDGSYPLAGYFRGDGPGGVMVIDVGPWPAYCGRPCWIEFRSDTADPTRCPGFEATPNHPYLSLDYRRDFTLTPLEPFSWPSTAPRTRATTGSP